MNAIASLLAAGAVSSCLIAPTFAECNGDLDGDGQVTVSELISAVNSSLNGCDVRPGPRFVDNGNGTVTDNETGLQWEQKTPGTDCLHCAERSMDWFTAMGDWISEVNGLIPDPQNPDSQVGLGGRSDWRVPNLAELRSVLDCFPCFNTVLGPDVQCIYWTSSTLASGPGGASAIEANYGTTVADGKSGVHCVRAVRGVQQ